ncbi:hypothetical protein NYE33_07005 [Paenibacillus sp. FSL R10-2199]
MAVVEIPALEEVISLFPLEGQASSALIDSVNDEGPSGREQRRSWANC